MEEAADRITLLTWTRAALGLHAAAPDPPEALLKQLELAVAPSELGELRLSVSLEPEAGLGFANCLDCPSGNHEDLIAFTNSNHVEDGGVDRGFGSLRPLAIHLRSDSHHNAVSERIRITSLKPGAGSSVIEGMDVDQPAKLSSHSKSDATASISAVLIAPVGVKAHLNLESSDDEVEIWDPRETPIPPPSFRRRGVASRSLSSVSRKNGETTSILLLSDSDNPDPESGDAVGDLIPFTLPARSLNERATRSVSRALDELFADDEDVFNARDGSEIKPDLAPKKDHFDLSSDDDDPNPMAPSAKSLGKRRAARNLSSESEKKVRSPKKEDRKPQLPRPSSSDQEAELALFLHRRPIPPLSSHRPKKTRISTVSTASEKGKQRQSASTASDAVVLDTSDEDQASEASELEEIVRKPLSRPRLSPVSGSGQKLRRPVLQPSPVKRPAAKAAPPSDDSVFETDSEEERERTQKQEAKKKQEQKDEKEKKRKAKADREKDANEKAAREPKIRGHAKQNFSALEAARERHRKRLEEQVKRAAEYDAEDHKHNGDAAPQRQAGAAPEMDDDEFRSNEAELQQFLRRHHDGVNPNKSVTYKDALEKLGLADKDAKLPGMHAVLLEFQTISVSWMQERELSKCPGGILADDMGLGKTVQTIALIAHRRSTDPVIKANLIVMPLSLLAQWEEEIRTKAIGLTVHTYHGSNKAIATSAEQLAGYDVVLTTHGRVMSEWPKPDSDKEPGNLFLVSWYRVVIDEAHVIRNQRTRISKAVAKLDSVNRWALTGTPIVNSLSDLYPLMRFLRWRPWCDWKFFKKEIMALQKKHPVEAGRAAEAAVAPIRMRRRKDDRLENGEPLVTLPKKHESVPALEFDEDERKVYDAAEQDAQIEICRYLKKGTLIKNMSHIFTLILRLRQLTVHTSLIAVEGSGGAVDFAAEVERAEKLMGKAEVAALRKKLLDGAIARLKNRDVEDAPDGDEDGCCPICMEFCVQSFGVVTACGHLFCRTCAEEVLHTAGVLVNGDDEGEDEKEAPCPTCRRTFSQTRLFELEAFEPTEEAVAKGARTIVIDSSDESEDDLPENLMKDRKPKLERKGKPIIKTELRLKKEKGGKGTGKEQAKPIIKVPPKEKAVFDFAVSGIVPSTKMRHCVKMLDAWRKEDPAIKTIIISSFTQALDLMDSYLTYKSIASVRFQGSCSQEERTEAIQRLRTDPDCRVMLLSLKAGGVGLNLTCACRVLNLDAGWSRAIEEQAVCRAFRLGQTREVFVERLTIADSIEERIHLLQDRKQLLSDMALEEGQGSKSFTGKISVPELLSLFRLGPDGKPVNKRPASPGGGLDAFG